MGVRRFTGALLPCKIPQDGDRKDDAEENDSPDEAGLDFPGLGQTTIVVCLVLVVQVCQGYRPLLSSVYLLASSCRQ